MRRVPINALTAKVTAHSYTADDQEDLEELRLGYGKGQWYFDCSMNPDLFCKWQKFDVDANNEIELKFQHYVKSDGDTQFMCFGLADGHIVNLELMIMGAYNSMSNKGISMVRLVK
jgi:hypothetical protein